jgi:threonine dehydrogenase-like Zn-dependent dehydrogenase
VAIPADDLVPVPAGVSAEQAALAEPLATALNGLDGLELGSRRRIAVIGLGPIGLLSAYAAVSLGSEVVGVDPAATRREHARGVGVSDLLSSTDELPSQSFDAVIDAVGLTATWTAGVSALAAGGTLVIVGLGENTGPVDIGTLVRAGLTIRGTYAYTREQFGRALQMLSEQPPAMSWVQRRKLSDGAEAFERLAAVTSDATKILLEVEPS